MFIRQQLASTQAAAVLSISIYRSALISTRHAGLRQDVLARFVPHPCNPGIGRNRKARNVKGGKAENIVMWTMAPRRLGTVITGISEVVSIESRCVSRPGIGAFRQLAPIGRNIGDPAMAESAARGVWIFDDQCEASGSFGSPAPFEWRKQVLAGASVLSGNRIVLCKSCAHQGQCHGPSPFALVEIRHTMSGGVSPC